MPWQRQVVDVGLELAEDGSPAYRDVTITVPRQSGKTTLLFGVFLQRALGWAQIEHRRQAILYSAQTQQDARKKLLNDFVPLLERRKSDLGVSRVMRANGNEGVYWSNGSHLGLLASAEQSGHGFTLDLGLQDELFADVDDRRDQAMRPAMITRTNAQLWVVSTAGTADSHALNGKVEVGRAAVDAGKTSGHAYFEWSATRDDDPADPATWWRCMPALGRTVTEGIIRTEWEAHRHKVDEFRRAYLNIPTAVSEQVIPPEAWRAVCDTDAEAVPEVFAVDVNPERSAACVVAAGGGVVEVVSYQQGTAWLSDFIAKVWEKYRRPVILDGRGPAGTFVDEFERAGVKVIEVGAGELPRACGVFYDAVLERKVTVRRHDALDAAVVGAGQRTSGDAWVWGRRASRTDVCPLVAASIGFHHASRAVDAPAPFFV